MGRKMPESVGVWLAPITLKAANEFIEEHHRHHKSVVGHKFSISLRSDDGIVGAVVVGRPVARGLDDGYTAEVTRLCTIDGSPKGSCSMLYGAAARAAKAMGYTSIGTYILESEAGTSLKASGWVRGKDVKGRSWSCKSRPRSDNHPIDNKVYWSRDLG